MPSLALRTQDMPASPIRKLAPFADAARARGIHIHQLNIGQPDLETPPAFLQAIEAANIKTIAYAPSNGYASYREKLARHYEAYGIHVGPEEILITTGGSEAVIFAMMACFDPGDELIVPEPFYANYLGFARMVGVELVPILCHLEGGYALPPVSHFEQKITPRTRGIILNNPTNPTGRVYGEDALKGLEQVVRKHDLYLLADEVYKEFVYEGEAFYSTLALSGISENVLMIDSISKKWSACGSRLGNLVTRNKDVIGAAMKFAQARLSPPTLGQVGAEALLELPDSYYEEVRAEYRKRRDLVLARLEAMPGVLCPRSKGAFYLLPQLPVDDTENFCQWLLESFEHNGQTVMLAPGSGFYTRPEHGRQQARIAYVLESEALEQAMDALEAGLKQYPGRVR